MPPTILEPRPAQGALTVEAADLAADRDGIEAAWDRGFAPHENRFRRYLTNPCGRGAIWVLRPESGAIVGAVGLHAREMKIGDRLYPVAQVGNLAVDNAYRSAGPAVRLQRALVGSLPQSGRKLIFGATSKATAILQRAGCRLLGDARWTKPLRCGYLLERGIKPAWAATLAAAIADVALQWTSRETFQRRPAGVSVEVSDAFDARFDDLWERAACQFPMVTTRSAAFLEWRFKGHAEHLFRVFCLVNASSRRLRGYIVYDCKSDTIDIVDLLFEDPAALDLLLAEFLRHLRADFRKAQSVTISYFGSPLVGERLRRFGFWQRAEPLKVLVALSSRGDGDEGEPTDAAASIMQPDRWFLTAADLDL